APGTAGMAEALRASERRVVAAPARPEQLESLVAADPLAALEETELDVAYPVTDVWGRREPMMGLSVDFDEILNPKAWLEPPGPTPVGPPAAPAYAAALDSEPEELDQLTWVPQRTTTVQVAGVALQRLSTYAASGISDWRVGFNQAGGLASGGSAKAVAWLRVDKTDRVFGELEGSSVPLALPGVWGPFAELELALYIAPPPMNLHYLGWVRLPAPLALPVPCDKAVSFGRGSEADLAPHLLADPHSLRWEGAASVRASGINAEYLGLSRRHLLLQARRNDWWVHLESQNMPAYRLAPSGDLLDVLSPGADTATTAKPEDLLVVGGYVLELGPVG
ncbi:MAG: hypothetical protein WAV81_18115, partial [Candidatus Competibacter sp.]